MKIILIVNLLIGIALADDCKYISNDYVDVAVCANTEMSIAVRGGDSWEFRPHPLYTEEVSITMNGQVGQGHLIDSRNITNAAVGACIQTKFDGLKTNIGFSDISVLWEVCLDNEDVIMKITASGESDAQILSKLYFPYSPAIGDGYLVTPMWHGFMLPTGWISESKPWVRSSAGKTSILDINVPSMGRAYGQNFYGAVDNPSGRAIYIQINNGDPDYWVRLQQIQGQEPHFRVAWVPQLGRFDHGESRSMTIRPLSKGNYLDFARLYRKHALAIGKHVSLRDKLSRKPKVSHLIGGVYVPVVSCYYQVNLNPPPYGKMLIPHTFDDIGNLATIAMSAKNSPITNGIIHVDGVGQRGYDNVHPDLVFPSKECKPRTDGSDDCGPCQPAGGYAGLKRLNEAISGGMIMQLHEEFRDFYADSQTFFETNGFDALRVPDHSLQPIDFHWAGGGHYEMCAKQSIQYVERNLEILAQHGIDIQSEYLDVYTSAFPDECYGTEDGHHIMTRKECCEARNAGFNVLTKRNAVVASEQFADWAVPALDQVYWSPYIREYDPNDPDPRRAGEDTCFGRYFAIPLPLIELVYHDAIVVPFPIIRGDGEQTGLDAWMSGGIAQIGIENIASNKTDLVTEHNTANNRRRSNLQGALHQAIAFDPMVSHSFVDNSDGRYAHETSKWSDSRTTSIDRDRFTISAEHIAGLEVEGLRSAAATHTFVTLASLEHHTDNITVTIDAWSDDSLVSLPEMDAFLHVVDNTSAVVVNGNITPNPPTTQWDSTAIIIGSASLDLSKLDPTRTYHLITGLWDRKSGTTLTTPSSRPDGFIPLATIGPNGIDTLPNIDVGLVQVQLVDGELAIMTRWATDMPLPAGLQLKLEVRSINSTHVVAKSIIDPALPSEEWPIAGIRRESKFKVVVDPDSAYHLFAGLYDPIVEYYQYNLGRIDMSNDGVFTVCPAGIDGCV